MLDIPGREPAAVNVHLKPNLSGPSSAAFVAALARRGEAGRFYRAEPMLLQGRLGDGRLLRVGDPAVELGPCPPGADLVVDFPGRACFPHDPHCGCHGPIMNYGDVGWAGGGAGPDFFIYVGRGPSRSWAYDHTVWGRVEDDASLQEISNVLLMPTIPLNGQSTLLSPVKFRIEESRN